NGSRLAKGAGAGSEEVEGAAWWVAWGSDGAEAGAGAGMALAGARQAAKVVSPTPAARPARSWRRRSRVGGRRASQVPLREGAAPRGRGVLSEITSRVRGAGPAGGRPGE